MVTPMLAEFRLTRQNDDWFGIAECGYNRPHSRMCDNDVRRTNQCVHLLRSIGRLRFHMHGGTGPDANLRDHTHLGVATRPLIDDGRQSIKR